MKLIETTESTHRTRHTAHATHLLLAAAGLAVMLLPAGVIAQNAAQQSALTRLGQIRSVVHPEFTPPNGVPASTVTIQQPAGLAFDSTGNLFIADTADNVILEVTPAGIMNTVAGTGSQGFAGDGGPATSALLDSPVGVAVDSQGNIYIGDTHNNRIREVLAATGNIVTIAGTGVAGFSGDGATATLAQLDRPTAVAVDSNFNIYFADTNNNRVREIVGATSNITTVAGNGQQNFSGDGGLAINAALNSPTGVAVDAAFNLYISDTQNQRVREVSFATGIITTIAGTGVKGFTADGPASAAALDDPAGIAVDASGNVYVADADNYRIREISGGNVTTFAGTGQQGFSGFSAPTNASLDTPLAVAVQGNTVAIADTANNSIAEVIGGQLNTVAGVAEKGTESLALGGPLTVVYGTGTITATFANASKTGTGTVTFYDGRLTGPAQVGQASLTGNSASLSTGRLSAGTHYIVASYAGDGVNPAIASGEFVLTITRAPLSAVANSLTLAYGQTIPTLTGTLTGVVPQDNGNVTAVYATTATNTSAPGTYPITVSITGSASSNYTVALGSGSGSLGIGQAPSNTAVAVSATPVLGVPVTLTATVTSTTTGTPTGTVSFYNGATLLNSTPAPLSGGVATFAAGNIPLGAVSITAVYSGDADFLTSTSSAYTAIELSPDFTISATPGTLTVLPTQSVKYTVTVTPVNSTFLFPVNLSVTGLPSGVTASFSSPTIASGSGISTSVMTLNASAQAQLQKGSQPFGWPGTSAALALLMLPLVFGKRTRKAAKRLSRAGRFLIALLALAAAVAVTGCGAGGFFGHSTQSYTLTVTGVSGPDTHSTNVTLTVQ